MCKTKNKMWRYLQWIDGWHIAWFDEDGRKYNQEISIEPSTCTQKSINNVNSLHVMKKKLCDLQKYHAARRRKTGPQELLAMFETLSMFRVSWKCTQNTSKINPCTVLVQEITNEDHNYCKHCDPNRSDSFSALTRANVSVFFWGLLFHFVPRPARASLVALKNNHRAWTKNWCSFQCSVATVQWVKTVQ